MTIREKFEQKKPVLSFEIFPPKRGAALQNIDETLEILSVSRILSVSPLAREEAPITIEPSSLQRK